MRIAAEIIKDNSQPLTQIAENAGISRRTVARYMKELQESGVLQREGSDTYEKWIFK
ncbi:MAG: winged helix-turn-helix transcriptional regulator [Solobacterium sp.]|nr:winged helix-turn-helix transcriptional regulator [Solobacterium sp.]